MNSVPMIRRFGKWRVSVAQRVVPDPFVVAIVLTVLTDQ